MSDFRSAPRINISSSGCIRAVRKRDPVLLAMMPAATTNLPRDAGDRIVVRLHGDAPEDAKERILRDADVFVPPARHAGFCVPIVEALAAGCKVIAYDNSNTPAVTGGLASLVSLVNVD